MFLYSLIFLYAYTADIPNTIINAATGTTSPIPVFGKLVLL